MSYTYRKADLSDIDLLVQLRIEFIASFGHPPSDESRVALDNYRDFLLEVMTDGSFVQWLCELGGEVVAYGSVSFYRLPPTYGRPNGRVAYIGNMFTHPAHRRKGLAKKILQLLVEEAKAVRCHEIRLDASREGRPLYENFGFVNSENTMRYHQE